uniref:Uncharacterized protein n=1 Tax=Cacopsylla melanoneura TaxID=428564 RepID=A0A8D8Q257_9HEMI
MRTRCTETLPIRTHPMNRGKEDEEEIGPMPETADRRAIRDMETRMRSPAAVEEGSTENHPAETIERSPLAEKTNSVQPEEGVEVVEVGKVDETRTKLEVETRGRVETEELTRVVTHGEAREEKVAVLAQAEVIVGPRSREEKISRRTVGEEEVGASRSTPSQTVSPRQQPLSPRSRPNCLTLIRPGVAFPRCPPWALSPSRPRDSSRSPTMSRLLASTFSYRILTTAF